MTAGVGKGNARSDDQSLPSTRRSRSRRVGARPLNNDVDAKEAPRPRVNAVRTAARVQRHRGLHG